MTVVTRQCSIDAPIDQVWAVLADFGAISSWADNVDHSSVLVADVGPVGRERRIQSGRTTVVERVVVWDEPKAMAYEIEGLPPLVRSVQNRWDLADNGTSTGVSLTTTVEPGPRPPMVVAARVIARVLAKQSDVMLAGLTRRLEETR